MKRKLMFLALATIGLASCNGGFKQGEGGLLYNIHSTKGGVKLKEGDFANVDMIVKTDGDSVLSSSYDLGHPVPMQVQKSRPGDFFAGLMLLAEGDSATFKISTDSIFKNGQNRPANIKGKYIIFTVKVDKVIQKGAMLDPAFQQKVMGYLKDQATVAKTQEPAFIKNYISSHNLKITKTASGLNYDITTPGSGPLPAAGDTAVVNYTGRFTVGTGKPFETSVKAVALKEHMQINPMNPYAPLRIVVGQGQAIKGWDEGLMLLNKGAKATFIMPSALAYGEMGSREIQPNTPLVFEVEMVNIIHPNPNAPKPAAPALQVPATK